MSDQTKKEILDLLTKLGIDPNELISPSPPTPIPNPNDTVPGTPKNTKAFQITWGYKGQSGSNRPAMHYVKTQTDADTFIANLKGNPKIDPTTIQTTSITLTDEQGWV